LPRGHAALAFVDVGIGFADRAAVVVAVGFSQDLWVLRISICVTPETISTSDPLEPNFSRIDIPTFSNLVILHTYPPMKMKQSVPKRRRIKFRRWGITQKKAYNKQYVIFLSIFSLSFKDY